MKKRISIAIIGGGPAGTAAAVAAVDAGVPAKEIIILERGDRLGGILNQCIHNGFGLHTFKEELTGPEYADRFIKAVNEKEIPYLLKTMVINISPENDSESDEPHCIITAVNGSEGLVVIDAVAVVLAMGCRERPRGALNIPGYRPAGIYSAGTAQRFVNMEGRMPGHEVVILGSGDIGLIMARRMTLEGAKVKVVAELMPYSGGLKRNIVQCLDDFGIPLKLSHTVVNVEGKERVEAVTIAEVGPDRKIIPGTEERYTCDTLLLSCGLIPENELSSAMGVELNSVTNGPLVDESLETSVPGVFACGNVLHVHDLVDFVTEEARQAGKNAAELVMHSTPQRNVSAMIPVFSKDGVRYTVPSNINPERMKDKQVIRFRVGSVIKDAVVEVLFDDKIVMRLKKKILAPGEMEQVILLKKNIEDAGKIGSITVRISRE